MTSSVSTTTSPAAPPITTISQWSPVTHDSELRAAAPVRISTGRTYRRSSPSPLRMLAMIAISVAILFSPTPVAARTCQEVCRGRGLVNKGRLTSNPYDSESVFNRYGSYQLDTGPYSHSSSTNRYATGAPGLYDERGTYRGTYSVNPYDSDSVSNRYGTYGNPYSQSSLYYRDHDSSVEARVDNLRDSQLCLCAKR